MSSTPSSNGSISLANVRTETSTLAAGASASAAASCATAGSATSASSTRFCRVVGEVVASSDRRSCAAALRAHSPRPARSAAASRRRRASGIGPRERRARLPGASAAARRSNPACADGAAPAAWPASSELPTLALERRALSLGRRSRRRLVARRAHELIAREQLAQLRDALRTRGLFRRRDAVARRRHAGLRQQRRREPARRIDLEIAEHARHGAFDGKRRERRALHEVRGRVALDDEERIGAERARVLGRNRRAQRRIDARGELLGGDLRAAKRLPLELAVRLRDQDAGRHGERQKEHREHEPSARARRCAARICASRRSPRAGSRRRAP